MPRFLSDVPHEIYRRRAFAIAAIVTGLFLLLFASLPLLFRSNPFLSLRTPAYEEIATEVLENLVQSSSFPLLIASIVFSIWGVSVYLRCLDAVLRRRLVAVAAICTLWMIEVIVKYKSFTPAYASLLWYLYYVPMTLIPILCQLCGFRLAGLERRRPWRRYRNVLWALAVKCQDVVYIRG